jgi:murein endopeptidase/LysM repeat protein
VASAARTIAIWAGYGLLLAGVGVLAFLGPEGGGEQFDVEQVDAANEAAIGRAEANALVQPAYAEALVVEDADALLEEALAEEGEAVVRVIAEQAPELTLAAIEYVTTEPEWMNHEVVPLETVEQVAHRYGVRPASVRMWNGLSATTSDLKAGASLRVKPSRVMPPRQRFEYVVQPGDTWWRIGTRYGVDSADLRRANWDAEQRLRVGQTLRMWIDPVVYQWVRHGRDEGDIVRRGAVSIGPPQAGRLVNGVLLPDSPYYTLRLPPTSYGTTHAVEVILEAIVRFRSRSTYDKPLLFGSMSARHGGPLTGHLSHQTGRDLDIRLPLRSGVPDWYAVEPKVVDWTALWHLINSLAETGEVMIIFFDYDLQKHLHEAAVSAGATEDELARILQWPRGSKAHVGLVRPSPGHEAHIHVRFTCGRHEPECVAQATTEPDGG